MKLPDIYARDHVTGIWHKTSKTGANTATAICPTDEFSMDALATGEWLAVRMREIPDRTLCSACIALGATLPTPWFFNATQVVFP